MGSLRCEGPHSNQPEPLCDSRPLHGRLPKDRCALFVRLRRTCVIGRRVRETLLCRFAAKTGESSGGLQLGLSEKLFVSGVLRFAAIQLGKLFPRQSVRHVPCSCLSDVLADFSVAEQLLQSSAILGSALKCSIGTMVYFMRGLGVGFPCSRHTVVTCSFAGRSVSTRN